MKKKLTDAMLEEARVRYARQSGEANLAVLAQHYGVTASCLSRRLRGVTYSESAKRARSR